MAKRTVEDNREENGRRRRGDIAVKRWRWEERREGYIARYYIVRSKLWRNLRPCGGVGRPRQIAVPRKIMEHFAVSQNSASAK